MAEDYREIVKRRVLDEATFVQMTLKGVLRGQAESPWRMIVVRPVQIKNRRHLQFSRFTDKQDFTQNYPLAEAETPLDEALALPFGSLLVRSIDEDLHVQITKKGRAILHRQARDGAAPPPELAHDAAKTIPMPADRPDSFLQALGLQTADGRVKADRRGKLAQINEFLKLMEHTGALETLAPGRPLNVLDCGCGASYLSFAVYHYLNNLRGIPARLVGVDVNEKLIQQSSRLSQEMRLDDAVFCRSSIAAFQPEIPPDIVIALHACDTATDEALALGITAQAGLILAAPCCHHHLNAQLETRPPMQPVMRHGILKNRLADILTDSFRALILRIMGYKTDVVEFVASEHTDRNLMIRAVRRAAPGAPAFVREYVDLKAFWHVTPHLETLLGTAFTDLLETV
ncbi:MAG: SAM-dependent methyltransferase [Chloroflexi bacterium]|nr:SAM-dependent methyltransferase [Chloroflexota bacterium]